MKKVFIMILYLAAFIITEAQEFVQQGNVVSKTTQTPSYKKGKLLYKDDFDNSLDNWVIETPRSPHSNVSIENKKLSIDVPAGATVWFKKKLKGNILIEYKRKVIVNNGRND